MDDEREPRYCKCGCGELLPEYLPRHAPKKQKSKIRYDVDESTGCWDWAGQRNRFGYGVLKCVLDGRKRYFRAHRYVYEQLVGPIPEGADLHHKCHNRACVNPDHLEPTTRAENVRMGDLAKLDWLKVREIRALYSAGATQAELAGMYGVTQMCISNVVRNRTWKEGTAPAAAEAV